MAAQIVGAVIKIEYVGGNAVDKSRVERTGALGAAPQQSRAVDHATHAARNQRRLIIRTGDTHRQRVQHADFCVVQCLRRERVKARGNDTSGERFGECHT